MAEESVFRSVLSFFTDIGIYDVILPFLLVFTLVFAILEKTRVLGTEEIEGKKYTRKNLNAMVAFATGFLTIASAKVVAVINQTVANVMLLLIVCIFFLLLVGSFFKESPEGVFLEGAWKSFFMSIMFIGLVLIFFNAMGWLGPFWDYLVAHWQTQWVASLIFIVVIILFMVWITKGEKPAAKEKKD